MATDEKELKRSENRQKNEELRVICTNRWSSLDRGST